MKVKIGNKIYDVDSEPIMLIFDNKEDRLSHCANILNMSDDKTKYLMYSNSYMTDESADKYLKSSVDENTTTTIDSIVVRSNDNTQDNRNFDILARTNYGEDIPMKFCQLVKLNILASEVLPTVDLQFINPIVNINLKEHLEGE